MDFPALIPTGSICTTGDVNGTASTARPEDNQSSASANTKGSWVETFASTPFQAFGIIVSVAPNLNANSDRLVDIGIGAAGSELVLIADLAAPNVGDVNVYHAFFPIRIPANVRLSHRSAASTGSQGTMVGMHLCGGGWVGGHSSCSRVETLGAVSADSGGTGIDPGGTAGTKGSWVQVPSATTTSFPYRWLGIGINNQVNVNRATANWLMDVAIGGAGSEQIILENLHLHSETNGMVAPMFWGPHPVSIPEGSQLSVRANCSSIDAADRTFDVILYGVG